MNQYKVEIQGTSGKVLIPKGVTNPLLYETWVREGKIIPPSTPKRKRKNLAISTGISLPEGTALRLLNEDRGD